MISPSDIKVGMYLTNNGPGDIPVYYSDDGTGTPELIIKPGELIGKVLDISSGAGGQTVDFASDAITANSGLFARAMQYISPILPDRAGIVYGVVNFSDLQKNITDAQVGAQNSAIDAAKANGVNLPNFIKSLARNTAETIQGAIPWPLVFAAAGGYVLLNWNTFFKPSVIRK